MSGFSVYGAFVRDPEFFQLYLSLAVSALEYQDSAQIFMTSGTFPNWAQVDQTVLPSFLGSLPSLSDLGSFCFDDESFFQAFAYTYGPEYATTIYSLFSDLLSTAPVTLRPIVPPTIPGLPQGAKMYECAYSQYYEQQFTARTQGQSVYRLCMSMPLHQWFESILTSSLWTSTTQYSPLVGCTDVATALQNLVAEDPWLWPFSTFTGGSTCLMGVVETAGGAQQISATQYQITSANPTILRFLVILPYQEPPPVPVAAEAPSVVHEKPLAPHIEEKLQQLERSFAGTGSVQSNKRIINEYKSLNTSKGIQGVNVEFENGTNMYVWLIHLEVKYFDLPPALKKDFDTYVKKFRRSPEIVFEARFDSGYPQTPPFLRVVSPRFAFHTGHITIGGSICTESLTRSGWTASRTLESILIEIISNMGVGNARLDGRQMANDYSLYEAQEAFHRVARQHGWQ